MNDPKIQNYPHHAAGVKNRHRCPSKKTYILHFSAFVWLACCVDSIQPYTFCICHRTLSSIHATNQLRSRTHRNPHSAHVTSSTDRPPSGRHRARLNLTTTVADSHTPIVISPFFCIKGMSDSWRHLPVPKYYIHNTLASYVDPCTPATK